MQVENLAVLVIQSIVTFVGMIDLNRFKSPKQAKRVKKDDKIIILTVLDLNDVLSIKNLSWKFEEVYDYL